MRTIFTAWARSRHSELQNSQPSHIEISISGTLALCTLTYLIQSGKQYQVQLQMNLQTNVVSEVAFRTLL